MALYCVGLAYESGDGHEAEKKDVNPRTIQPRAVCTSNLMKR